MKKTYFSPQSILVALQTEGNMMNMSVDPDKTTSDNFSNRNQGWNSEDWSGTDAEDEE